MTKTVLTRVLLSCVIAALAATAQADPRIATGSRTGTYIQIARNLWENSEWQIENILETSGSVDNIKRLEAGTAEFAIVQSDAIESLKSAAERLGETQRLRDLDTISFVLPLYLEEIQVLVRNDDNISSIRDLEGKRVNIGPEGSGNAVTASIIADRLNIKWTPRRQTVQQSIEDVALRDADAAVIVGGIPYKHLVEMKPAWRKFVKLLPITNEPALQTAYLQTIIPANTYPWQDTAVATYGVPSVLVASRDARSEDVEKALIDVYKGIKDGGRLVTTGHPKWREIQDDFLGKSLDVGIPVHPKAGYWIPLMQEVIRLRNATSK